MAVLNQKAIDFRTLEGLPSTPHTTATIAQILNWLVFPGVKCGPVVEKSCFSSLSICSPQLP